MKRIPARIANMALDIVRREGGFVDDPDDPGGATKYGVTIKTLRRLGMDVDGDGDIDKDDVRALTIDDAVRVFVTNYFFEPGLDKLPEALQPLMFDFWVHSGRNAGKILQRVLNRWLRAANERELKVDGIIGPKTLAIARAAYDDMGQYLVDALAVARRGWLISLAKRRPALRKYVVRRDGGKAGWVTRAEEFMRPEYRLDDERWQRVKEELSAA